LLDRLRQPIVARLAAPALLLGIALAWAAPARAARAWDAERERAASLIAKDDAARVEQVLTRASRLATSPEEFAAEVARALADLPRGEVSPAADALLKALFGRMIQAMSLGLGSSAAFVSSPAPDRAPAPEPATTLAAVRPAPAAAVSTPRPEAGVPRQGPLEARPQVQTQGP
jgi:hypothetical protein